MHILLINDVAGFIGGREVYVSNLITLLQNAGHHVSFLHEPEILDDGEALGRFVKEKKIEILHTHCNFKTAGMRALGHSLPMVASLPGWGGVCPAGDYWLKFQGRTCERALSPFCLISPFLQGCNSRRPWKVMRSYRQALSMSHDLQDFDFLITPSRYTQERYLQNRIRPDQIETLYYGFPTPVAKPRCYEPFILYAGRIQPQKGLHRLIDALIVEHIALPLVVIGEGAVAYGDALKKKADRYLPGRVQWVGKKDLAGVEDYLQRTTLVVVPSIWDEPFGMVGVDAMRFGKPVVAFAVGGIPEWLEDGKTGLLAKRSDARDLGRKVRWLLEHPAEAQRMGEQGEATFRRRFTNDLHLKALMGIYQKTIALHRQQSAWRQAA